MKLKSVKIHDYKCFVETNEVQVANDVTCLVGVNETGKSIFLEALTDTEIDGIDGSKKSSNKNINKSLENKFCTLCWSLDNEDINLINTYYNYSNNTYNNINIMHYYNKSKDILNFVSNSEYITFISKKFNLNIPIDLKYIDKFAELVGNNIDFNSSPFMQLSGGTITGFLNAFLEYQQPRFMLFKNQSTLNTNIKLSSIADKTDRSLVGKILEQNGLDIDIIKKINSNTSKEYEFNRAKYLSESYCNDIIRKYWPNQFIDIQFNLQQNHNSDNVFNGFSVSVCFKDNSLIAPVDIKDRSMGLQAYASLMLSIAIMKDNHLNQYPLIILLDEPDCHLHASTQKKIRDFIYNDLQKTDFIKQVIYTTHSPFMINKERIDNICVFENIDNNIRIHDDIYKKDNLSIIPLSNALGYNLSDTMFINNYNNICTEGDSDINYISAVNRILPEECKIKGDYSYVNMYGLPNKIYYCKFLIENGKNPIVILDNKNGDNTDKYKTILPTVNNLILYKSILECAEADVEDMFGMENYTHLMVLTFSKLKPHLNDLAKSSCFKDFKHRIHMISKSDGYDYDCHMKPADYIRNNEFYSIKFPDEKKIIDNFTKLIKAINDAMK